jgi:hypothetical protein
VGECCDKKILILKFYIFARTAQKAIYSTNFAGERKFRIYEKNKISSSFYLRRRPAAGLLQADEADVLLFAVAADEALLFSQDEGSGEASADAG